MADIDSTLPVTDSTDGTIGVSAPSSAQQIGGKDGSGNLQAISTDSSGHVNINNVSGTVTLPTGASTAANQTTANTSLATIATNTTGVALDTSVNSLLKPASTLAAVTTLGSITNTVVIKADTAGNQTNSLKVDGSAVTQPISAASLPLPTGAATSAKQPALGTAGSASADVITVQGIASMTALKVDGSAVTQPISGTVTSTQGTSPWVSNISQFGGSNVATGPGASGIGIPRVTVSNDSNVLATQSGTWNITNVSGTVSLPTGAATSANQTTIITNLGTIDTDIKASQPRKMQDGAGNALASSTSAPTGTEQALITRNIPSGTQTISGTVTANAGTNLNTSALALDTSVNGILVSQSSTTSGAKGPLVQGAVTTSSPSYTTGQTNPISLTTAGAVRVDGSATIQPVSGTVTANQGTSPWSTQDLATSATGSAVPTKAIMVAGTDGTNLRAIKTDYNGDVNVVVADGPSIDAFGRLRVAETDLIESLHFANTNHPYLINTAITGSATSAYNSSTSSLRLTCTTSSSDTAIAQTKRYFRYNPGRSYIVTLSGNIGTSKANVTKRWGYFDANNGLFFSQTISGLFVNVRTNASGSPVDNSIAQSSWNLDKLDGTGSSGINLDTSKHNLYVIDFLWHGAGRIRFGIFYNGKIVYCHQVNEANVNTTPFMRNPSLPLRVELNNIGTTASTTTVDLVCFSYQKESSDTLSAPYIFSASTVATSTTVGNTILPLIAIRPKTTFNAVTNRIPVVPQSLQVAANQNLIYVVVYLNPVLTGASFTSADANSVVEYDVSSTAVSGGIKIREFYVAASSSLFSEISSTNISSTQLITLGLDIAGSTQDTFVIAARSTGGGTATWAQLQWEEFQ